jgi:hypothetical protein
VRYTVGEEQRMKTTIRFIGVMAAALATSALLGACSTEDSALDNTFSCSGGGSTMQCLSASQYCEQASNGTTVTRAVCLARPAGCATNPCDDCLRTGTNGIILCTSITFGTTRATTVTVRQ